MQQSASRKYAFCAVWVVLVVLVGLMTCSANAQTGYWHTSGNQILDANGHVVRIAGVNWYGFETTDEVAHGLWAQDYHYILNAIKNNGYDVIRVPMSNQMVETPIIPTNISYYNSTGPINADLHGLNSLQILDKIVSAAGALGLHIILDNHRSEAGNSAEANGLWYTTQYPESAWINDWVSLTQRYLNNTTVIGMDLRNEPHNDQSGGSCWGCGLTNYDWRLAAGRGGNAVLAVNPHLLIFVEGTDCYNNDCDWWGGNLEGALTYPVNLNVAHQLVYSAHDYGPNLYQQSWFNNNTTYQSLVGVWTRFWAYLSLNGIAPVWVGEFGTTNNSSDIESSVPGSQGQWFQSIVTFLQSNTQIDWTYWALNGEDSYALLDSNYDSTPVSSLKQQLLAGIQFGGGGGSCQSAPPAPTGLVATAASSSQINLTWNAVMPPPNCSVTYNIYSSTLANFLPAPSNRIATGVVANNYANTGLQASTTYYYIVRAADSIGESGNSNRASAKTQSSSGSICHVTYTDQNDWGTGFTGAISIRNTGTQQINGWRLTWTWSGNQQIIQSWNSNYTQSGQSVALTNAAWNGTINPGDTLTGIGFNANYSGTNNNPTTFYVNGSLCQ
ncbi:MAG: cellulase family glycosylhydrolase [Candidatus Korobacteraceae bacterium]